MKLISYSSLMKYMGLQVALVHLQDEQPKPTEWVLDSGCTNHMTGDKNLSMDTALSPSNLKHITYTNKGKSKVLGLVRVVISKDRHMDKVMLVESLGFNLMSVSMLCDLWQMSLHCTNGI